MQKEKLDMAYNEREDMAYNEREDGANFAVRDMKSITVCCTGAIDGFPDCNMLVR